MFGLLIGSFMERPVQKKRRSRIALAAAIAINLCIIFIFKYLSFFTSNMNILLQREILPVPRLTLPIGISFFTFQAISYVIDIYRGNGKAQKNIINVGLYIAFFPQLIAGPIVRYETIAEQISYRKETMSLFSEGSIEFVRGLCKKVLLANTMANVADRAFSLAGQEELSILFAWVGIIAYTFEIYYDFSGYSEMAIGLGKMFGFQFLPNFNYPYISGSISEFWRRWHISLGTWFRDYVYFPMGGSRVKSKGRLVFNLFVVWTLTGIWHGANWTFICWGLMYFILITAEKLSDYEKSIIYRSKTFRGGVFKYLYTMLFVMLGWVLFRADSLQQAWIYIKTMFGFIPGAVFCDYLAPFYIINYKFYFAACILCAVPLAPWLAKRFPRLANVRLLFYAGALLVALASIVKGAYNPFIYFNF